MYVKHINLMHLFHLDAKIIDKFAKQEVLDKVETPFNETEIILNLWQEHNLYALTKLFEEIIKYDFKKITILADINSEKNYWQLPKHIINKFNFVSIDSMHAISEKITWNGMGDPTWAPTTSKGLLLTGKLGRYNRIELLRKLYFANALDNIIWTFPLADQQLTGIVEYYLEVHDSFCMPDNFVEFFTFCKNNAAVSDSGIVPEACSQVIPYFLTTGQPWELYKQANFVIISETSTPHDVRSVTVTEKTHMAILNHRPFIMVGAPNTVKRLKNYGYRTFDNYLPYRNYDNVIDIDERLTQIVENIKAFPKILLDHYQEINDDVTHNFNLFNEIANNTEKQLEKFCLEHGLDASSIAEEFGLLVWDKHQQINLSEPNALRPNTHDLQRKSKEYMISIWTKTQIERYNTIKGVDWPNINNKEDFDSLPDHIKKECQYKFNLSFSLPKNIPGFSQSPWSS